MTIAYNPKMGIDQRAFAFLRYVEFDENPEIIMDNVEMFYANLNYLKCLYGYSEEKLNIAYPNTYEQVKNIF